MNYGLGDNNWQTCCWAGSSYEVTVEQAVVRRWIVIDTPDPRRTFPGYCGWITDDVNDSWARSRTSVVAVACVGLSVVVVEQLSKGKAVSSSVLQAEVGRETVEGH